MSDAGGEPSRVVLDTNTVLALWMFRDPGLAMLAGALERGDLQPWSREDAIEELRRVLAYRQFAQLPAAQLAILEGYRASCRLVDHETGAGEALPRCRDADDQKFLEIAASAAADCLITRDKALLRLARHRLLRGRFAILTPEAWVSRPPVATNIHPA